MFGLGTVPSLLFLLGVMILPESPRFLLRMGREKDARRVLGRVGDQSFIDSTVTAIQSTLNNEVRTNLRGLFTKAMLPVMAIGIGLAVFQQFCGINVVFNYTTNIFKSIGASSSEQLLQAVWISLANLAFTLVAMALVDKLGRRPMMMAGYGGLSLLYIVIGYLLFSKNGTILPLFIFLAIGTFAISLGPLTWVLISEIFPNHIRGTAISLAVVCLWSAYFILVSTFPVIEKKFGDATAFWAYAIICAAGFMFIWLKLPETKGKSLETIENEYLGLETKLS
jgi:sugar porter (SP) family MFS transporter